MNNPNFDDYIDIYPKELEIKDTTNAPKWDNYIDLYLEFEEYGKLFTQLYDKRDDLDFPIVNFPYFHTRIPCIWCFCFTVDTLCSGLFKIWRFSVQRIHSGFQIIEKGILFTETSDYFWKFYGRHADLLHKFDTFVSQMLNGLFTNCDIWLVSSYLG